MKKFRRNGILLSFIAFLCVSPVLAAPKDRENFQAAFKLADQVISIAVEKHPDFLKKYALFENAQKIQTLLPKFLRESKFVRTQDFSGHLNAKKQIEFSAETKKDDPSTLAQLILHETFHLFSQWECPTTIAELSVSALGGLAPYASNYIGGEKSGVLSCEGGAFFNDEWVKEFSEILRIGNGVDISLWKLSSSMRFMDIDSDRNLNLLKTYTERTGVTVNEIANSLNNEGMTLLMVAASRGRTGWIKYFISLPQTDKSITSSDGRSACDYSKNLESEFRNLICLGTANTNPYLCDRPTS